MLRAIREIQPRWLVGENVLGLVNWSDGLVFHEVQADLEAEGYEVQPFVLPAVSVNAPHRRDRVWFVAHASKYGGSQPKSNSTSEREAGVIKEQKERIQYPKQFDELHGFSWITSNANGIGLRGESDGIGNSRFFGKDDKASNWEAFPTVSPIRMRDDGVSDKLLRFVVKEFYDTISYTSQENRIKNLQEVWDAIQSEEIWEQIRGFYSLESKNVLLQTMQLYSSRWNQQGELSPFGEELCQPILQHLSKYKEFRCSPQGQELEKQRFIKFGNTLSFLPHEVALAARRFETAIAKFESWHRNESIKAGGNAVVPQVVLQIFKAIAEYEEHIIQRPSV